MAKGLPASGHAKSRPRGVKASSNGNETFSSTSSASSWGACINHQDHISWSVYSFPSTTVCAQQQLHQCIVDSCRAMNNNLGIRHTEIQGIRGLAKITHSEVELVIGICGQSLRWTMIESLGGYTYTCFYFCGQQRQVNARSHETWWSSFDAFPLVVDHQIFSTVRCIFSGE